MLKVWNAVLVALTFVLCIFGTYITRSGIVDSVHTFGKSLVGTFFLVFLLGTIAVSAGLILVRRRALKPEHALETAWGREGAFVAMNVLLLVMTGVTTVGTIFPVISNAFTGKSVSVSQPFYNKVVVPMGLCLMALMAVGPLLTYGKGAVGQLKKHIAPPLLGGLAATVALAAVWRVGNGWALVAAFIVGVAAVTVVWDLVATVGRRMHSGHENVVLATVRTIDGNHRRYGGQTVHVGMLMIMVGIAGSSVYGTKHVVQLAQGGSKELAGGWRVTLEKVDEVRGANYAAVEATVRVSDPRGGETMTLRPQRRFYDKAEDSNSEVANWSTWRRDAYVTLAGWEDGGRLVALEMFVNPLVAWLWIGGIVITAGGVLCLLPRLIPRGSAAPVAAPEMKAAGKAARRGTRPVLETAR
jgi:cytochrome c-type biogenesis protein CcmF